MSVFELGSIEPGLTDLQLFGFDLIELEMIELLWLSPHLIQQMWSVPKHHCPRSVLARS